MYLKYSLSKNAPKISFFAQIRRKRKFSAPLICMFLPFTDELHQELNGEPEDRVDTGTLSLIIAVLTASLLTILITCLLHFLKLFIKLISLGCVCAFRCCGNLKPIEESRLPSRKKQARSQVSIQKVYWVVYQFSFEMGKTPIT